MPKHPLYKIMFAMLIFAIINMIVALAVGNIFAFVGFLFVMLLVFIVFDLIIPSAPPAKQEQFIIIEVK